MTCTLQPTWPVSKQSSISGFGLHLLHVYNTENGYIRSITTPYPQTIHICTECRASADDFICIYVWAASAVGTHPVSTWEGWRSHVTQQSEPRYWHKADGVPVSLPGNRQGTISQLIGRSCYLSLLLSPKEHWCIMITRTIRNCTYQWLWSFTPPLYSISSATASGIMRESWPAAIDSLAFQWALCCVCGLWDSVSVSVCRTTIDTWPSDGHYHLFALAWPDGGPKEYQDWTLRVCRTRTIGRGWIMEVGYVVYG